MYFFTVVIADRTTPLLTDRIGELFAAIRTVRASRLFRMPAMVVLPDHLHGICAFARRFWLRDALVRDQVRFLAASRGR